MYFLLYVHNQVISGKEKAAIYDLEHSKIIHIPSVLIEVLEAMRTKTVKEIKQEFTPDNPEIIDKYLKFFTDNDLGYFTKNPSHFPKMNLEFQYPGTIQHAVLETDVQQYDLQAVLKQLDTLGCRYVELRIEIDTEKKIQKLEEILLSMQTSIIISFELFTKTAEFLSEEKLQEVLNIHPKINKIVLYDATQSKTIGSRLYYKKESFNELEKKSLSKQQYIVNRVYFTESIQYNPSYHKTVSVSKEGNIKNTLYDNDSFGNVATTSLETIVESEEFQKYWTINADKIEGVKDSPLRYAMCNLYPLQQTEKGTFIQLPIYES